MNTETTNDLEQETNADATKILLPLPADMSRELDYKGIATR